MDTRRLIREYFVFDVLPDVNNSPSAIFFSSTDSVCSNTDVSNTKCRCMKDIMMSVIRLFCMCHIFCCALCYLVGCIFVFIFDSQCLTKLLFVLL